MQKPSKSISEAITEYIENTPEISRMGIEIVRDAEVSLILDELWAENKKLRERVERLESKNN